MMLISHQLNAFLFPIWTQLSRKCFKYTPQWPCTCHELCLKAEQLLLENSSQRIYVPWQYLSTDSDTSTQTTVSVPHYTLYLTESNFVWPTEFLPEWWLDSDAQFEADKKDTLQPFVLGPRNCLGKKCVTIYLSLALTLANLDTAWHILKCAWCYLNWSLILILNFALRVRIGLTSSCIFSGISLLWWSSWLIGSRVRTWAGWW